jgi:hypothetical protein
MSPSVFVPGEQSVDVAVVPARLRGHCVTAAFLQRSCGRAPACSSPPGYPATGSGTWDSPMRPSGEHRFNGWPDDGESVQFARDVLEIPDPVGPTGSQVAAERRQGQCVADAIAAAHGIDHAPGCVVDRHELPWRRLILLDVEVEGLGRVLRDDEGRVGDRRTAGATRYGDVYGGWYVVDQIVKRERGLAADDCVGSSCGWLSGWLRRSAERRQIWSLVHTRRVSDESKPRAEPESQLARVLPRHARALVDEAIPGLFCERCARAARAPWCGWSVAAVDAEWYTFDDTDIREAAREDPREFVAGTKPMIIDEIQRLPELLLSIKARVDTRPHPGQFSLTGSARVLG